MVKLISEKRKNSSFTKKKSLVGLAPGLCDTEREMYRNSGINQYTPFSLVKTRNFPQIMITLKKIFFIIKSELLLKLSLFNFNVLDVLVINYLCIYKANNSVALFKTDTIYSNKSN